MIFRLKNVAGVLLLNLISICVLTSCATSNIAKYPSSWAEPEPIPQDTCADVSGIYENKAMDVSSNKDAHWYQEHPIFLSNFLSIGAMVNGYKHKWITHIKISGVNEKKLTVEYYKKDKIINKQSFVIKQDFICTTKGVIFESSYNKVYDIGGGFGHRVTKLIFAKAKDDSLLLTKEFSEKGMALIIFPFIEKEVSLYKFNKTGINP